MTVSPAARSTERLRYPASVLPLEGEDVAASARSGKGPLHLRLAPHKQGLPTWAAWLLVTFVTAGSLALGLYHLTTRSLWIDEGYTWLISGHSGHDIWSYVHRAGGHLIGYYLLIHLMISWFGDSVFVLRLPSVIAAAASVPLIYLLGARLGSNRQVGVFAAALLAVSQPLVFWQQNARDYSFVVLLAVGASLVLTLAVQDGNIAALIGWGVITVVGCYTHPELMYLVPVHVLVFLIWARSWVYKAGLLVGAAAVGGFALPAVINAFHSQDYTNQLLGSPNSTSIEPIATFLASGGGGALPINTADHALLGITVVVWVAGLVMLMMDIADIAPPRRVFGLSFAVLWLVAPPVTSWIVSETGHPSFTARYLMVSLPGAALVMALVLVRIRPRTLGYFGLAYLMAFRFGALAPQYSNSVDDYAGAARYVVSHARSGDCTAAIILEGRANYDYYATRDAAKAGGLSRLPYQINPPVGNGDDPVKVEQWVNPDPRALAGWESPVGTQVNAYYCSRLWLLESHTGSFKGNRVSRGAALERYTVEHNVRAWFTPVATPGFAGVELILYDRVHKPAKP